MPLKGARSAQKEGTATKTREVLETTTAYNNILTHEGSLIYPSGKSMSFYLQGFFLVAFPPTLVNLFSETLSLDSKSLSLGKNH